MDTSTRNDLGPAAAMSHRGRRGTRAGMILIALLVSGCGTTRWTNSPRTATEMLLVSNAIDQAVDRMDFRALAGESVYFDDQYLAGTLDHGYIVSSIRQKLLASGSILKDKREDARYVVEARSGGVGTDQTDVTFGIPSVSIPPALGVAAGVPASSIPEVPLIKKSAQKGMAKLAVFAYERETGLAVWQSGASPVNSTAQHTWFFGAGPFQQGTIYDVPKFAGTRLPVPKRLRGAHGSSEDEDGEERLSVTSHAVFLDADDPSETVRLAGHEEPAQPPPAKDGPSGPSK